MDFDFGKGEEDKKVEVADEAGHPYINFTDKDAKSLNAN